MFENPLLIRFQTDRKLTFDPFSLVRTGSKMSFRSVWKLIKSGFSKKLSHVIINFEEEFGLIKKELTYICFTWLPLLHSLLDQKLKPLVLFHLDRMEELNHDLKMKDHFKITHDLHEDKKTSFIGSLSNKMANFIAKQKAKIAFQ